MKKTKRLLAFVLAFLLMAPGILPGMEAQAAQAGDFAYEVNEDGKGVTITGYQGNGGALTIPAELAGKKVTDIGENAFAYSVGENLTSVTIEEGVETIGNSAFADCGNLESVRIPGSVKKIGSSAFYMCPKLDTINIAEGVCVIGQEAFKAFEGCALKNITIPASVTEIGYQAIGYVYRDSEYGYLSVKNEKFVIRGAGGTAAEKYAKDNGFRFLNIGAQLYSVSRAELSLNHSSYMYDGKAKKPSVTVKLNGKTLKPGTDYTVSYSRNVKPGTAKVTVTGKGIYTGKAVKEFTIKVKSGIMCKKKSYDVVYGKTKPFKINALSAEKLTFVSSNKKVAEVNKSTGEVRVRGCGTAAITVKAGRKSVKVTVTVKPEQQRIKYATSKGKNLIVIWQRGNKVTGYEVQVSTDKKFKKIAKKKKITKNTKTMYTFKKLQAKTYHVRVRSYKKSGKKQISGAWSKPMTIRVF